MPLGIEIKVWRDRRADPLAAGLMQLERYLARLGVGEWLAGDFRQAIDGYTDRGTIGEGGSTDGSGEAGYGDSGVMGKIEDRGIKRILRSEREILREGQRRGRQNGQMFHSTETY